MTETAPPSLDPLWAGFISEGIAGTGGKTRVEPTDFYVEEIPLYSPAGEGHHTLFEIEKRGISTLEAIRQIARELGIHARLVSSAGLKDAHAVTRQLLSVEGVPPEIVRGIERNNINILWAERHRNRLKIGHLKGNRFAIRIRDVAPESLALAEQTLAILMRRGVPNGFGQQRFGVRNNTHLLGRAMLRKDMDAFWREMLGSPRPSDEEQVSLARRLFEAGDRAASLNAWPDNQSHEYQLLRQLAHGDSQEAVYHRISRTMRRLYVAAYQSYLFNLLLAERLHRFDQLEEGDLAVKHDNGAYFAVLDVAEEQPRVDRLEISPSAPLYGYKVRLAGGAPGRQERALIESQDIEPDDWRVGGGVRMKGERRPLRAPLANASVIWDDGLLLRFELPKGAYATNVLREIMKDQS